MTKTEAKKAIELLKKGAYFDESILYDGVRNTITYSSKKDTFIICKKYAYQPMLDTEKILDIRGMFKYFENMRYEHFRNNLFNSDD